LEQDKAMELIFIAQAQETALHQVVVYIEKKALQQLSLSLWYYSKRGLGNGK
jgi:hypothetical protein